MKRRTTPAEPPAAPILVDPPPTKVGGKGRPTPKRNEAEGKRRTAVLPPPTDRKEAAKRLRENAKESRLRQRVAVETGDEKNYPALHAGKERGLVRDVVDARKSVAWIGVPAFLVLFMLTLVLRNNQAAVAALNIGIMLLMGAILTDVMIAYRQVKRALAERFPTGTRERTSTLALYGVARNNQIPARRRPRPRVKE